MKEDKNHKVLPESEFVPWCARHWVECAKQAIETRGRFVVALSGGKTPEKIYQTISQPQYSGQVDWKRVFLLWSDERAVSPEDPSSNYRMAMQAGFNTLGIPENQILRMHAENHIEENAKSYSEQLERLLKKGPIDLCMLGMGEDGHIASLFPHTQALSEKKQLAISNWVPKLNTFRMTMTYPALKLAELNVVYVMGSAKSSVLSAVWSEKEGVENLPAVGLHQERIPTLWVCDNAAVGS